jgi:hypothetical protein
MLKKISPSWLIILVGLLQWQTDRWWPQWVGITIAISALLATWLYDLLGFWITLSFGYISLHYAAFTLTFSRFAFFKDFARVPDRLILRTQGLEFFTYALLFTLLVLFQFSRYRISVRVFFARLYFAILIATLGTWVLGYGYEGYLGNWGMNVCLLVCLTPFVPRFMWFISGTLVLLSDASTAYAVFAVVLLSEFRKQWRMVIPGLTLSALSAAYIHPSLMSDSERFKNWKYYLDYWWDHSKLFGFGPGSFGPIGPYLQGLNGEKSNFLLWAHNEYLQVFFEFGLVGFSLFGLAVLYLYRRLRDHQLHSYESFFVGAAACALTDYPLRLALFMVVIVLAISEVLYGSKKGRVGEEEVFQPTGEYSRGLRTSAR